VIITTDETEKRWKKGRKEGRKKGSKEDNKVMWADSGPTSHVWCV